jgi:hypothetical protein
VVAESTNDHPEPRFVDPETALGGADAVEKTTYVVGAGTDPNATSPKDRPASVGHSRTTPIAWVAIAVAVIIAIVYLVGFVGRP